jgi:hypothetical protein
MEPSLITQKALKKILKKNYFKQDNYFNKAFNDVVNIIKFNWLPIIIVICVLSLLIYFYFEQQARKKQEAESFEADNEINKINIKSKEKFNNDFKQKPNYESEYYKMLPRVTNNPDVMPYQY